MKVFIAMGIVAMGVHVYVFVTAIDTYLFIPHAFDSMIRSVSW